MNIGIDLGGSHIAVGLVDEKNNIIIKQEHNWTEDEKSNLFNSVEKQSKKIIKEIIESTNIKIDKIGIGYPSANIINGVVTINGVSFNLPEKLSNEFNVPVYLKNDVKCSALCEKNIGNIKEYENCIFMTLGTGIGGAFFYKNKLVTPNKFPGFEIGHTVIEINGKECKCGRKGCFEQYASMRIFRGEIEKLFSIEKITSDKLLEFIAKKEKIEEINLITDKYLNYLCVGIVNLINIFEPDAICIGGSFAYYESIFMDKLKEKVKANFPNREIPKLLVAKYANDAGIIGASMLIGNI